MLYTILPEFPGRKEPRLLTVLACLTIHPFPISRLHFSAGASWYHLPSKLLALKFLSQHLLLEEPTLRHPLNETQIHFQPLCILVTLACTLLLSHLFPLQSVGSMDHGGPAGLCLAWCRQVSLPSFLVFCFC